MKACIYLTSDWPVQVAQYTSDVVSTDDMAEGVFALVATVDVYIEWRVCIGRERGCIY